MHTFHETDIIINGLPGNEGVAIGPVLVIDEQKKVVQPRKISPDQVDAHIQRFEYSKQAFLEELESITQNLDSAPHEIFEAQKHIVSDVDVDLRVKEFIAKEYFSVDFAIYETFNRFIERLKESGSELFMQRIVDLENLRDRLIELSCNIGGGVEVEEGSILVVKEISPTDLVTYHDKGVCGLVMDKGGVTSHAAIIAQSLNIPCIVSAKHSVKAAEFANQAIIDASTGEFIINPSNETLAHYKRKIERLQKEEARFQKNERSETVDGHRFFLNANVEFVQELPLVAKYKAEGVGLLRTEALLYSGLAHQREADQIEFYESILAQSTGPVVIRLFDVGGDKLHLAAKDEDNPFLGWRGIRMLLDERELLQTQLKAILVVSARYKGRIRILLPMVTVLEEIREIKKVLQEVKAKLTSTNIAFDNDIKIGVMVEVPSVALLAHHFAQEVDFFSIGTNDLTQYSLAVDRGNERICTLYQHYHPAILHLINATAQAAKQYHIEISVCGELAGDVIGAAFLVGLGVNNLSMSPANIPKIKHFLSTHTLQEFKHFAQAALSVSTAQEVKDQFEALL